MCSVSGTDSHSPQNRPTQPLGTVGTPHTLINAIHWLHRPCGAFLWFDRLEKAVSESRLGYLYTHAWHAKTVLECVALMLSYKLHFSCFADMDKFPRASHILPIDKAIIHGKDSQLSEKTEKVSLSNVLQYTAIARFSSISYQCTRTKLPTINNATSPTT